MDRKQLARIARVFIVLVASLPALTIGAWAQTSASNGTIDVSLLLPGTSSGARIANCVSIFAIDFATNPPPSTGQYAGGTCDASGLRDGVIDSTILVDVPNVRILLGAGTLTINSGSGFKITAEGVSIEGQGNATLLDAEGRQSTTPVIEVNLTSNVVLSDLQIRGDVATSFFLVSLRDTVGARISGLDLHDNGTTALFVRDVQEAEIDENTFSEIEKSGVLVTGDSRRITITRNRFERTGLEGGGAAGAGKSGHSAITITGGLDGNNLPLIAPSWIHVAGNQIRNFGGVGIRVSRVRASVPTDVQVIGNQIEGYDPTLVNPLAPRDAKDGEGITISAHRVQVIGNRVDRAYTTGILLWLSDANGNVLDPEMEHITVSGNTISNSSQMVNAPPFFHVHHAVGMIISAGTIRNVVITDNVTFDDQLVATQKYAVALSPGGRTLETVFENLYVEGNVALGNFGDSAVHEDLDPLVAKSGNLPEVPEDPPEE